MKIGSNMNLVGSSGGGKKRSYLEYVLETESTELADGLSVEC